MNEIHTVFHLTGDQPQAKAVAEAIAKIRQKFYSDVDGTLHDTKKIFDDRTFFLVKSKERRWWSDVRY